MKVELVVETPEGHMSFGFTVHDNDFNGFRTNLEALNEKVMKSVTQVQTGNSEGYKYIVKLERFEDISIR